MLGHYIISDMVAACAYLPYGIGTGVLTGLLLYGINVRRRKRSLRELPVVRYSLFFLYLTLVAFITFFSRESGSRIGIDLALFSTWGNNARNHAYVVENVLLFLPYGFLLAHAFPPCRHPARNLVVCFLSSLTIETVQLLTGRGYFQVDDILTNVLGGGLGVALFWLTARLFSPIIKHK